MCSIITEANYGVHNIYTTGVQIFYAKRPYPLFWAGSRVASESITIGCVSKIIYYCAHITVYREFMRKVQYLSTCYYAIVRKKSPYERVKVFMVRKTELFECPDPSPLDFFFCVVGCKAKFRKERRIYETNFLLAFWMLLLP